MSENGLKEKLKILDKNDKDLCDKTIKILSNITKEDYNDKEIMGILGCYFKLKILQKWSERSKIGEALENDQEYLSKHNFKTINDFFETRFNDKKDIVGKTKEWDENKELKFFISNITQWFQKKGENETQKECEERIETFGGEGSFNETA